MTSQAATLTAALTVYPAPPPTQPCRQLEPIPKAEDAVFLCSGSGSESDSKANISFFNPWAPVGTLLERHRQKTAPIKAPPTTCGGRDSGNASRSTSKG